jgi:hypothetical protein
MTADERRLLAALTEQYPAAAADIERNLASATVTSSCSCGCGSIGFVYVDHPDQPRSVPTLFPVEGEVLDALGNAVGGLLLFMREDRPDDLEVYSYGDEPLSLPPPEQVRWVKRDSD